MMLMNQFNVLPFSGSAHGATMATSLFGAFPTAS